MGKIIELNSKETLAKRMFLELNRTLFSFDENKEKITLKELLNQLSNKYGLSYEDFFEWCKTEGYDIFLNELMSANG